MSEQYLSHLKCDYEFKRNELKTKHKIEVDQLKKNNASSTQIKGLKEKQKREAENLKSEFEQSKKKRPRLEEEWIPLGSANKCQPTPAQRHVQPVMPAPRNTDPLKTIDNNIKYQVQRRQILQATRRLSNQCKKKNKEVALGILSANDHKPLGLTNGKLNFSKEVNNENQPTSTHLTRTRQDKRKLDQSN